MFAVYYHGIGLKQRITYIACCKITVVFTSSRYGIVSTSVVDCVYRAGVM